MASTIAKTVRIQDFTNIRREALAASAITPGHLLALASTGKVAPHAVAGGSQRAIFAIEDSLLGNGIDDAYATDALVSYHVFRRGDRVNAILADGQTVVIGDALESAGNGKLRKYEVSSGEVPASDVIVGYATTALDLSSSDAVDTRIVIEIA